MTRRAAAKRKPAQHRTESGRAAFKRGHGIERRAAWWLRLKLYRIVAINWRSRAGEVDLIARRGGTLAFIEVKQRKDTDAAMLSLRPAQQQRLARAAALFCAQRPEYAACTIRFDLVAFGRFGSPSHMKDAWRPD
jgi:putative endonuclease